MTQLRRLSQYYVYRDSLEKILRYRLVCSVNHERMQQQLLSKGASLTLQKALDIALSLESAIWQATAIQTESQKVKETAEENFRTHALNIITATHRLEDEVEDSDLLAIY